MLDVLYKFKFFCVYGIFINKSFSIFPLGVLFYTYFSHPPVWNNALTRLCVFVDRHFHFLRIFNDCTAHALLVMHKKMVETKTFLRKNYFCFNVSNLLIISLNFKFLAIKFEMCPVCFTCFRCFKQCNKFKIGHLRRRINELMRRNSKV